MREKVCCILDQDESFVIRLADMLNEKHMLPYRAMAFTSPDALEKHGEHYQIKLLVTGLSAEMVDEINVEYDQVIRLVDTKNNADKGSVYKYQPADYLLKDIVANISGYEATGVMERTNIISVYSPATKCFKTSTAIALAMYFGQREKTLLISLEQFAGLSNVLTNSRGGLSKALYYYGISGDAALGKVLSCMDRISGFDYLAPVFCADDVAGFREDDIVGFIDSVSKTGGYTKIVVDIAGFFGAPWKVMEYSDKIIVPKPLDYMGQRKLADFEKYILSTEKKLIYERLQKQSIPYLEELAGYEISITQLEKHINAFVGGCIND